MTTSRPDRPDPTPMTIRSPEDLIAFAPIAVGFAPDNSVVMLSLQSPTGGPHARVDLPPDDEEVDQLVEVLLGAARRNAVGSVAFVIYDEDTQVAHTLAARLELEFLCAGIEVCDVVRVTGGHWFAMVPGHPPSDYEGVPYGDVSTHRFTLEAILRGRVVRGSRRELAALVRPREGLPVIGEDLLGAAPTLGPGDVAAVVQSHVRGRSLLSDEELASVAKAVSDPWLRDECWSWLDRSSAVDAVDLWCDAVARLPEGHAGDLTAVLGFVAWLSGDGALAWCAVDRCREVQHHNSLASLVSQLLDGSVSPDVWDRRDWRDIPPAA